MKIRAKDGDEINLESLRQSLKFSNDVIVRGNHDASFVVAARIEAHIAANRLLDALEAALSVPKRDCEAQTIEMSDYKEGWNECRDEQRRRIGVIEEPA